VLAPDRLRDEVTMSYAVNAGPSPGIVAPSSLLPEALPSPLLSRWVVVHGFACGSVATPVRGVPWQFDARSHSRLPNAGSLFVFDVEGIGLKLPCTDRATGPPNWIAKP
jgi:hypothetical protein